MKKIIQIEQLEADLLMAKFDGLWAKLSDIQNHFQPIRPTEYLKRKEVAELFKVSIVTIIEWTKKEILISYRIGNRVFYKRHEVEAALTQINLKKNTLKK